jgi:hypothetical protein
LAGAYNLNSHARGLQYLTFVCGNKAGKINAKGASRFKEKCLRKAQHYQSNEGEVPFQMIEFANICRQKTTTFL